MNGLSQSLEVSIRTLQASPRPTSSAQPPASALRARDAALFDLVEQRLVADAENLRGLAAVPVHLPERLLDGGALRFHRRRLRDGRERPVAVIRRSVLV